MVQIAAAEVFPGFRLVNLIAVALMIEPLPCPANFPGSQRDRLRSLAPLSSFSDYHLATSSGDSASDHQYTEVDRPVAKIIID